MTGLCDKIRYFGYEQANYIIKVYPNVSIYRSIYSPSRNSHCDYLFADRATRCPKTHTQPGRADSFFVAWNSLKYGEKSYSIAYFNEFYLTFSQNRVKIGPKFVLWSETTKFKTRRSGGWGVGGYSHIRTVRVCAARKPPIFRP